MTLKPTLRLHRGSIAATLGLTLSLTLVVVFSGSVLLAQTFPPQVFPPQGTPVQNPAVQEPPIPVVALNVVSPSTPQTATPQTVTPQTTTPQTKELASRKLHQARKAVATRDIASAERLVQEVTAMQLSYHPDEDQPARVQKLIQDYRQLVEFSRTQGNTEQFRQEYARFHLIQADTMIRRGELDLAVQLTQEAAKMQVQHYSPDDRSRGLEPTAMTQRITDARRAQNLNAPAAPIQMSQQPLSQAAQAQLQQAVQILQQARTALDAGRFDQAEQMVLRVAAAELPEYAFAQSNSPSPSRLLTEISARRQGIPVNPPATPIQVNPQVNPPVNPQMAVSPQMAAANPQTAAPHQTVRDSGQIIQASAAQTMAPPIPIPGRPGTHIDETIRRQQMLEQQISSEIMQKLSDAQRMTQIERRPAEALEILYDLKRRLEQHTQLDTERKTAYIQHIDRVIAETQSFQERYRALEAQNQMNEAVWEELRLGQQRFLDKEETLAAMFKEYKKYVDENRFEEALIVAKKAREFAPGDPATELLATMAQLVYNDRRSRAVQREKEGGFINAMIEVDRGSILPDFAERDVH